MYETSSPLTTGAVARLLKSTEPRVAETVRRGRIKPEPTIVAGRRIWSIDQVLQAAEALGVDPDEVRERLDTLGQQQRDADARLQREGGSA